MSVGATLCRPCHKQIYAVFTNEELWESYDSLEALRDSDRLAEYLEWIRGTDKFDVRIQTSDRVRERRT